MGLTAADKRNWLARHGGGAYGNPPRGPRPPRGPGGPRKPPYIGLPKHPARPPKLPKW